MPDAAFALRPAYGEPELRPEWNQETNDWANPHRCGWNLGFYCNLSVGPQTTDEDSNADHGISTGPLEVTVSLHGQHFQRSVTADQLIAFGNMLIALGTSHKEAAGNV